MATRNFAKQAEGRHDSNVYADSIRSMKKLQGYLCTRAAMPRSGYVQVDECRKCESQCAYGRRYIQMYDKQEEKGKMTPVKKSVDQVTKQEQLEKVIQERDGAVKAMKEVIEENEKLKTELEDVRGKLNAERFERLATKLQLIKLKAKLYDAEHPEEDDD